MFKNSLPKGEVSSAGPRGSPLCGLSLRGGPATPQLQGLSHPAFRSFISKMQILFRSENPLGPWLRLTSGQASPADKRGRYGWHARLTAPVTVTDVLVMCFWKRGFLNYLNQASLATATCLSVWLLCPSGQGALVAECVQGTDPHPPRPSALAPWLHPGPRGPVSRALSCCQPCAGSQVSGARWQCGGSSLFWDPGRVLSALCSHRNRAAPLALEAHIVWPLLVARPCRGWRPSDGADECDSKS